MGSSLQIHVKTRGSIQLPKKWRQAHHIEDGDLATLTDIGNGVFVMRFKVFEVNRHANQLAEELHKEGVTLEEVLEELRKIRK